MFRSKKFEDAKLQALLDKNSTQTLEKLAEALNVDKLTISDDQHFVETQNCIGSSISALAAAIFILLDVPEEDINYFCDVGQLLMDVYHQQSLTRKAFITPLMNKAIKPTLEAAKADQEKACTNIKAPEKTTNSRKPLRTWKRKIPTSQISTDGLSKIPTGSVEKDDLFQTLESRSDTLIGEVQQ
ncbi:hypothetical protein ALC56_14542 [Trachymyrmex septentrionalis]|uniref:Uncharacterized protein n=1 Tax=Trachymyrmex septentrionalis TaxID=34720 RepID=A0A195ESC9_9HYME|nr:hypothetical protein ALC56_14542 [Trachymyrmex septentrionalis]